MQEMTEEEGIEAVLVIDHLRKALGDGLGHNDLAVEAGLLIQKVDEIVDKGPEKVPLSELQDLLGSVLQEISVVALIFKRLIA